MEHANKKNTYIHIHTHSIDSLFCRMAFGYETSHQYYKNMIIKQITSLISEARGQNVPLKEYNVFDSFLTHHPSILFISC
jgi:hypothetical protein